MCRPSQTPHLAASPTRVRGAEAGALVPPPRPPPPAGGPGGGGGGGGRGRGTPRARGLVCSRRGGRGGPAPVRSGERGDVRGGGISGPDGDRAPPPTCP